MPFTTSEKVRLMNPYAAMTIYVALGIGTTELSGHGYSRGASAATNNSVNQTNGVLTIAAGQTIYTPDDNNAQDSTHFRLSRHATATNQWITEWQAHNDIAAPVQGQPVQTGTITLSP